MKQFKFLFLVLIFSFSCKQEKPKQVVEKKITPPVEVKKNIINDSISGYINPKLGFYGFKFITNMSHHELKKIKIYSDGKLVQTINTNKDIFDIDIKLTDWNFDGYKDITVFYNCGSGGCAYWIWNYSPKLKKFVYNSVLSEVLGLEMDSISKYIVFHYRAGYQEEKWDTMKYINNKLVFVKGLFRERGTNWAFFTRSKMVNNKIVTTHDSCLIKDQIPDEVQRYMIKNKSYKQKK